MIDSLKALLSHSFQPGTFRADVSSVIPGSRLDLETVPPRIVTNDGAVRDATSDELATILAALQALPLLRPLMTRREIMDLFTTGEKTAIRSAAPELIEMLLAATEPIAASVVLPYFRQLQTAGVITVQRFTAITGEAV